MRTRQRADQGGDAVAVTGGVGGLEDGGAGVVGVAGEDVGPGADGLVGRPIRR